MTFLNQTTQFEIQNKDLNGIQFETNGEDKYKTEQRAAKGRLSVQPLGVSDKFKSYRMQANVEAVRVAGLVTTLVSMAGDNRRMDSLPNSVGPRVCNSMHVF